MKKQFVICGLCGWCMELLWTGLQSFRRRDPKLSANTSVWMFPIYGLACLIGPVSDRLSNIPLVIRGCTYAGAIYFTEYVTGTLLKKNGMCPWDYSRAPHNVNGVIRADFAPLWFAAGLFYESLLKKQKAA